MRYRCVRGLRAETPSSLGRTRGRGAQNPRPLWTQHRPKPAHYVLRRGKEGLLHQQEASDPSAAIAAASGDRRRSWGCLDGRGGSAPSPRVASSMTHGVHCRTPSTGVRVGAGCSGRAGRGGPVSPPQHLARVLPPCPASSAPSAEPTRDQGPCHSRGTRVGAWPPPARPALL